jgi:hypothetical protein
MEGEFISRIVRPIHFPVLPRLAEVIAPGLRRASTHGSPWQGRHGNVIALKQRVTIFYKGCTLNRGGSHVGKTGD